MHARGVTAYGYFEASGAWGDEPIAQFTRAKVFQKGTRTDVTLRFSTVAGGRDSSEAARDPRGFAVKFYTEDGNRDLVGNNLAVVFIRGCHQVPRPHPTLRSRTRSPSAKSRTGSSTHLPTCFPHFGSGICPPTCGLVRASISGNPPASLLG